MWMLVVCQSWLWADLGLPSIRVCVAVCVCVLTRKEIWIFRSDFNGTLVIVHCYSLVLHCKIWKDFLAHFYFFLEPWFRHSNQWWHSMHSVMPLSSVPEVISIVTYIYTVQVILKIRDIWYTRWEESQFQLHELLLPMLWTVLSKYFLSERCSFPKKKMTGLGMQSATK